MGTNKECDSIPGSNVIAQHLFLGSSVLSVNANKGWGGSETNLSVSLINDVPSCHVNPRYDNGVYEPLMSPVFIWKDRNSYPLNHYYNCTGNDCYIDENGFSFNPDLDPNGLGRPPSKERIVPGKVYHVTSANSLDSNYWKYPDPGFFGDSTNISFNGRYDVANTYKYDLIGVPAYFRFGYFTFGGIIKSWTSDSRGSQPKYNVTLGSADVILKNCKVILSKYAGSVFTKFGNNDYAGGPTNYAGWGGTYRGLLKEGNLANVFNVYGFLESYGYGASLLNDKGVPLSYILDALSVLTSVNHVDPTSVTKLSTIFPSAILFKRANNNKLGYHSAYSPFGRILTKCLMTDDKINPQPFIASDTPAIDYSFGIMKPTLDEFNIPRVEFLLDLSEIPRLPLDVRYDGDAISSISDIITQACDRSGRDWYTTIVRKDGLNFIKVKTVDRTSTLPTNTIESIIKQMEDASPSIPVTTSSFGKNLNESATPRVMYIGANQQRLFQTKSYLLGYSNTHLVYHPILKRFVDYYRLCKKPSDPDDGTVSIEEGDARADAMESFDPGLLDDIPVDEQPAFVESLLDSITPYRKRDEKTTKSLLEKNSRYDRWANSYRVPMAYSVRNIALSNILNGQLITELFANEQALASITPAFVSSNNRVFETIDEYSMDSPIGGSAPVRLGNYWFAWVENFCSAYWFQGTNRVEQLLPEECYGSTDGPITDDPLIQVDKTPRHIPLWYSSICPFFGYANDQVIAMNSEKGSNIYRFVRPVYLDTWSGLLNVGFRCNELPMLTYGMLPVFYAQNLAGDVNNPSDAGLQSGQVPGARANPPVAPASNPIVDFMRGMWDNAVNAGASLIPDDIKDIWDAAVEYENIQGSDPLQSDPYSNWALNNVCFVVTETEFRAAQAGWEEYLAYCLMKMPYSKPDLFTFLVKQYQSLGKLRVSPVGHGQPLPDDPGLGSGRDPGGPPDVGGGDAPELIGTDKRRAIDVLNLNFNWILNPDFIRDWIRITSFVKSIADQYYGKTYLVTMPEVLCYRDRQYADLQIPVLSDTTTLMAVYQGSGKLFFNYELVDYAWEEIGNYIDDSIIIGSPDYYKLCNKSGMIPPLLGYNANPVKDYISQKWCVLNINQKVDRWIQSNAKSAVRYRELLRTATSDPGDDLGKLTEIKEARHKLNELETMEIGKILSNCSRIMVPSLDLSSHSDSPYVLTMGQDAGREDAYGNKTIGEVITLLNGDTILDPTSGEPLRKISLSDAPGTLTDESRNKYITGAQIPIPTVKAYFIATYSNEFVFLDPLNLRSPRALLTAPGAGLNLYSPSFTYTEDPTTTVIANMAAEDLGILEGMARKAVTYKEKERFNKYISKICKTLKWGKGAKIVGPNNQSLSRSEGANSDEATIDDCYCYQNLKKTLIGLLSILDDENFLLIEDQTSYQTKKHYSVAPRKAHPFFAAVPVKDTVSVYGPWTNYPMIADQRVYTEHTPTARSKLVEQLIANTDVKQNNDWAPWNYGGMSFLDREIINQIDAKASYQVSLENGTIVTAGLPIFDLSGNLTLKTLEYDYYTPSYGMFMYFVYSVLLHPDFTKYGGLALSSLQISVNETSITTTYKFDTYTPKLGLFSKEFSDRNKLISTLKIAFASEMSAIVRETNAKLIGQFFNIMKENSTPRDINSGDGNKIGGKLYTTSPIQYLVGSAAYMVPGVGLPYCGDPGLNATYQQFSNIDPEDNMHEADYIRTITRTKNWVGAYVERESLAELASRFNTKSVMSLDGIFSPVSFYPTADLGSYPISSRFITEDDKENNVVCPMCNGSLVITHFRYYDPEDTTKKPVVYPCPSCNKSKLTVQKSENNTSIDAPPDINFLSLNPIIMPTGEFQNPNSQVLINNLERSRHNIRVVGRQEVPQQGDISLDINNNLDIIVDKNTKGTNYDYINTDIRMNPANMHNPDFCQYDLSYGKNNEHILLNQRFFAFRGPIMLHGWGYDTEGYPVPNLADEAKEYDSKGRPKRFVLTPSGANDLKKDGRFLPDPENDISLGDIIGSGYVMENGEWIRKPTRYFHLNWGERSDLWPIGPIDLRWDRERKVWVGGGGCGEIDPPYIMASGTNSSLLNSFVSQSISQSSKECPYKMIYVVLEENLFGDIGMSETYPARAFIDDTEYGLEPMPYSVRRLVYVKDRCGYSAPRGAKLLCRYNRDTGFYEPVAKPSFIIFGTLVGTSNTAVVELTYIRGIKAASNIPKTNITFDNTRFNFDINASKSRRGMFLFENGKWILTGFN
jgi:hypothetical protein